MSGPWRNMFIRGAAMSFVVAAQGGIMIDFNTTTDLTTFFNGDSSPGNTNIASGGLGGSGSVQVSSADAWTLKSGTAPVAGMTHTISAYMYNGSNSGYGYLGLATATGNDMAATMNTAPLHALGVSFHGGGGAFLNNTASQTANTWSWGSDHSTGSWYLYTYTVTLNANNTFEGSFTIDRSDSSGAILSRFGTQSFSGYTNTSVLNASTVYAYFGTSGSGRFHYVDNFSTSVIPEPTTMSIIGLSLICVAIRRRALAHTPPVRRRWRETI